MKVLQVITAIILLIGIFNLPIGYYTFLRIAATIAAIVVVFNEFENGINAWVIIFSLIAIVFNPIIPVYLHSKSAWQIIDLVSGVLFLFKAFFPNQLKPIKQ